MILNLSQYRLFYFPPGGNRVYTYPIGIGVIGWKTPLGATRIARKQENPTWYPPPSIRAQHRAEGEDLPAVVPPGPDNPLGAYALYLGWPKFLIHDTNKPDGVGRNVSHGCIHLYPDDIAQLYPMVSVGTPVRAVQQPVTVGWSEDGGLYTLVFPSQSQVEEIDIDHPVTPDPARGVDNLVRAEAGSYAGAVDWDAVLEAAQERTGMPVLVADRSGMARREVRRNYAQETARSYSDRGAATRSYDSTAPQPAYDRGTAESYLPYYGSDAPSYGRGPAQPYPAYDRDDAPYRPSYGREAEQWGSPPTPDAASAYRQYYGPYPWRNAW
jgi:hypothetical protein